MEKAVKGATKLKMAAPKTKYIEPILAATRNGESGAADVFRTLQLRLRDSTWTIVFKSLIVAHMMIREGQPEVTLRFLAESPKRLAISTFTEVQTQGLSIRRYYEYLQERVKAYQSTKTDFVRVGAGKMKDLTVNKGLLRQTEIVQDQIRALVKCDFLGNADYENEIAITAFRLVTLDLLELFKAMNEGTINVLEHYFEMSKVDAERALSVYKSFGRQTDQVVQYLSAARQYEAYTKLEVPKLKHAPTTLTSALEDYLNDPDFDINRRQYIAQQEAKRSGKPVARSQSTTSQASPFDRPAPSSTRTNPTAPTTTPAVARALAKGPAPDLIDFFDSIEQNQQTMGQPTATQSQFNGIYVPQQAFQQAQIPIQQTGYNPFMQNFLPATQVQQQQFQQPQSLQPEFSGVGFNGYTQQPPPPPQQQSNLFAFQPQLTSIPQGNVAEFQQTQPPSGSYQPVAAQLQPQVTSTNPFRQSVITSQSTNPFGQPSTVSSSPQPAPQLQQQEQVNSLQQLQPQMTGTNPFAKNRSLPPPTASPISVNVTGSTNPFRQSQFVSQATGQGWQHSTQGTFAGWDMNSVETKPVFPRPGA